MKVFVIKGKPIPWMRAGRHGWKYFDRQLATKNDLRWQVKTEMNGREPYLEPLKLTIEFHMLIPPSWSAMKRLKALKKPHSGIPDLDNLTKFINDALNGILWADDSLIYEFAARKYYSDDPKTILMVEPYAGITLEPLPGLQSEH